MKCPATFNVKNCHMLLLKFDVNGTSVQSVVTLFNFIDNEAEITFVSSIKRKSTRSIEVAHLVSFDFQ